MIPSETQILNELEARAGNISVNYGYTTSVVKIERSRLTPFEGDDWPQLSFWITSEATEADKYGGEENTLTIVVGYFDETRDDPFVDLVARLRADVLTALNRTTTAPNVSDNPSYDLGGLVASFNLTNTEFITGEGQVPWCGCFMSFTAKYMANMHDPYNILTN